MSADSEIEWTDATWNPTRGCRKISPGCKHCYAETFAERFRGVAGHPYEQGFDPRLAPEQLGLPLTWRRPQRVFVDSMSDLFMDEVPDAYIAAVFGVAAMCQRHTFQVLTKRASRMRAWAESMARTDTIGRRGPAEVCIGAAIDRGVSPAGCDAEYDWPCENVHLGVSVEDRRYGLPRIDVLRETPAALRFLSVEPLLEDLGAIDLRGIGWVIVGGESGQGARECHVEWVRSIVAQCRAAHVPVFVKQLGRVPRLDGRRLHLVGDGGRPDMKGKTIAQWPEDLRVREMP